VMLAGLAVLIGARGVMARANVTILAQLMAGAFGKGAVFYVCNLPVALALGLATNTSFGGSTGVDEPPGKGQSAAAHLLPAR